jgi:tRNA-Thr(GGU) m(6)t(6)A37 methyltransferase TsaA
MSDAIDYTLQPVGFVRSPLKNRRDAPKQGNEGAPDVWLEFLPQFSAALNLLSAGDDVFLFTWLHQGRRETLEVHPRGNPKNPLTGVFATRSPDRPNPLGLHRVRILEIGEHKLRVGPLEVIDGTPVVDIKPALPCEPCS